MVACLGRFGLVYAFAFGPPFWPPLCVPVDVTRFCDGAVVLFELLWVHVRIWRVSVIWLHAQRHSCGCQPWIDFNGH